MRMLRVTIFTLSIIGVSGCLSSSSNLNEKARIRQTVNSVGTYADQRQWNKLKKVFADKVLLDYRSMTGQKASMLTPNQIIASWKFLEGFDKTHHFMSNHKIKISVNKATVFSYVYAVHYIKNHKPWIVYGSYNHELVKKNGHKYKKIATQLRWMAIFLHPQGDLNPCCRNENPVS